MDRAAFLDRVRTALAGAEAPEPAVPATFPATFASDDGRPPEGRADRFALELAAVGGEARRVRATGVQEAVAEVARAERATTAVVADDLGPFEAPVLKGLQHAGCRALPVTRDTAAAAALGVTTAALAVASTGSVLVRGTQGSPRIASLLPDTHLVVVPQARLVGGFEELFERLPAAMEGVAGSVLITGPSRTADIEMQVVRGVHGPRSVTVLLVGCFACPACGFGELLEPPWRGTSEASHDLCPCCGIQFGLDDGAGGNAGQRAEVHRRWRAGWIEQGSPWFSSDPPPPLWDPVRQLAADD